MGEAWRVGGGRFATMRIMKHEHACLEVSHDDGATHDDDGVGGLTHTRTAGACYHQILPSTMLFSSS